MTIAIEDVKRAAALAELAVTDAELPRLVEQMRSIVDYVEQLNEVPAEESAPAHLAGPAMAALREDIPRPGLPPAALEAMAPEFRDGLFLVPRRGTLADE